MPETMTNADDVLAEGCVTVRGVTEEYGIGRSRCYELIAAGELECVRLGRRTLVPRRSIKRLLAAQLHRRPGRPPKDRRK